MDKLTNKHFNIIGIVAISIAIIMLILVIVLPLTLKTEEKNDFTARSLPELGNINLWAKFPGELKSNLIHKYGIFNYKLNPDGEYQIEIKSNISIEEKVAYDNFSQNENKDTIYFFANRTYNYTEEKSNNDTKINSINMGLFETLESMTYPPLHKIGINSIHLLLTRVLIEPDLFIRELFTYDLLNEIKKDETIIKNKILINIPNEKVEKIISKNETYIHYSLSSNHGVFEWVKILGLKDKIEKANWLSELFELTQDEIYSILENNNSYLNTEYKKYNSELANKFNCENKEKCDIELLYQHLVNATVISTLYLELKDYLSLNNYLETKYYPFDKTPEMKLYFDKEFINYIPKEDDNFNNYSPSKDQLNSLLKTNSENCLLSPNNSIYLIYLNKTKDLIKDEKYYLSLTSNQILFLSKYLYEFLPKVFLYPEINIQNTIFGDEPVNVDPMAKTVSSMTQNIADKTYKLMRNLDLYNYMLMTLIKYNLKEKTHYEQYDELCPIIMQKILDDGKKAHKICSDENIGFDSDESLKKWMEPFYCFYYDKNSTKCNMYIIDYLKNLVYITDEELNEIFSENYLGGAFKYGLETIQNTYKCGDRCEEKGYFIKLQFWEGNITSEAPSPPFIVTDTIQDWFPEKFEYPVEISHYIKNYSYDETVNEEDIDFIIKLVSENENKYDLESSNSFIQQLELEKQYSLYIHNNKQSSLINLINFLIDVLVFKEDIYNNENEINILREYSSIKNLIQGNNKEDEKWVKYLKSGNYFENFKPNLDATTGLDIGINLDTKKQEYFDFDYYGIFTKNKNNDKRKINKMNNLTTLNIKKKEYDCLKKSNINLLLPLYDYESLLDERKFSDGFQYDHSLNVLYFYDIISSRPLRFKYSKDQEYKNTITCRRYDLDVDNLAADMNEYYDKENKNAFMSQKLNKPYMITADFDILKKYEYNYYKLNDDNEKKMDNYICVDPITDMVINSNINLIYAINTRKYGFINKNIVNKEIYPIFTYQRKYDVEVNSYEQQFPGITEINRNMTVFIIIGVIVIILFIAVAVLVFYCLHKRLHKKGDEEEVKKESLAPLSDSEFKSSSRESGKKGDNINSATTNPQ